MDRNMVYLVEKEIQKAYKNNGGFDSAYIFVIGENGTGFADKLETLFYKMDADIRKEISKHKNPVHQTHLIIYSCVADCRPVTNSNLDFITVILPSDEKDKNGNRYLITVTVSRDLEVIVSHAQVRKGNIFGFRTLDNEGHNIAAIVDAVKEGVLVEEEMLKMELQNETH